METIANAVKNLGYTLFENHSYRPQINAQRNLSGRTHYADPDTLRFFHARILKCYPYASGLVLRIVESVALDHRNTSRGVRFVAFDVFGTAIIRPNLQQTFKTSAQACIAFDKWYAEFDVRAHYLSELDRIAKRSEKTAQDIRATLAKI